VLMVSGEDDISLKRNRALSAGAIDFLSVEPFHVLRVMKTLDDALRMFG